MTNFYIFAQKIPNAIIVGRKLLKGHLPFVAAWDAKNNAQCYGRRAASKCGIGG
jgi:hypothetical protein